MNAHVAIIGPRNLSLTNALRQKPYGFLGCAQHARHLVRRGAFSSRRDNVDRHKPFVQRKAAFGADTEVLTAISAAVRHRLLVLVPEQR